MLSSENKYHRENSWQFTLYSVWLKYFKAIFAVIAVFFQSHFLLIQHSRKPCWLHLAKCEFLHCWMDSIQEPKYIGDNKHLAPERNHLCRQVGTVSQLSHQLWDEVIAIHQTLPFTLRRAPPGRQALSSGVGWPSLVYTPRPRLTYRIPVPWQTSLSESFRSRC